MDGLGPVQEGQYNCPLSCQALNEAKFKVNIKAISSDTDQLHAITSAAPFYNIIIIILFDTVVTQFKATF